MPESNLSAVVCVGEDEIDLPDCLSALGFANEIVVVLDRPNEQAKAVAAQFNAIVVEGKFEREGDRRHAGIAAAAGPWIFELDADELVSPELAAEISETVRNSSADRHTIPVENYIGDRKIKYGLTGAFAKGPAARLFHKGTKSWGRAYIHPTPILVGVSGHRLMIPLRHRVDRDVSGLIARLNSYSTLRAKDLRAEWRDKGKPTETLGYNVRQIFVRFYRSYWKRKGRREGRLGFVIALIAGLYPILSYLKATIEDE
jgi:glycosyltransferase involved in cell wall biosynthesis